MAGAPDHDIDLLELEDAMGRLAEMDARKCRVVELRFFGGLDIDQTAEILGVARSTTLRDWKHAKLWLRRQLRDG